MYKVSFPQGLVVVEEWVVVQDTDPPREVILYMPNFIFVPLGTGLFQVGCPLFNDVIENHRVDWSPLMICFTSSYDGRKLHFFFCTR